jgi:uncharacterized protein
MKSRLYDCRVTHVRHRPKHHRFSYRVFYLAIDLGEIPELEERLQLLSFRSPRPFRIRLTDYLPVHEPRHHDGRVLAGSGTSLLRRVQLVLTDAQLPGEAIRRVELVTLPRMFGYAFNPVSYYFCRGDDGAVVAAVAEVTNTFGEIKPYVIDLRARGTSERSAKDFYVSPFSAPGDEFEFRLTPPRETLRIGIDTFAGGQRTLSSVLAGRSEPLTDAALLRCLVGHPLLTARVITGIHWQALQLFLKAVPWRRKADHGSIQRGLYRPHASLRPAPKIYTHDSAFSRH